MHVCRRERQYRPLIVSQSLVSPFPLLTNYVQRRGVSIQQYIVRYTPEKEQKHKNDENNIKTDTYLPSSVSPSPDTDKATLKVLFTNCLNDLFTSMQADMKLKGGVCFRVEVFSAGEV